MPCRRPGRHPGCLTDTSRESGTPTRTRTTGASGAAARARSGTCARLRPSHRRTPTPSEAPGPGKLPRPPVSSRVCLVKDDFRRSPPRTRRRDRPSAASECPNSSIYKVLENLIFNSLKFYSLIYIKVKVFEL